jgi:hypothetical protein
VKYQINKAGARSIDDVAGIARKHGVSVPDDVVFFIDDSLPENVDAAYGGMRVQPGDNILWSDLYAKGKIPVRMKSSVLASDEAIVGIIGHEMHELNNLRTIFKARKGKLTALEWEELVGVGRKGNLHDEAWDIHDQLIEAMRAAK